MNLEEARKLAKQWTNPSDIGQGGWKEVIYVLNDAIDSLVLMNSSLVNALDHKTDEVQKLSLDLGIKDQNFVLGGENEKP